MSEFVLVGGVQCEVDNFAYGLPQACPSAAGRRAAPAPVTPCPTLRMHFNTLDRYKAVRLTVRLRVAISENHFKVRSQKLLLIS